MVERMIMGPGQTGPFVRDLQLALNARLMPSPNLMVNGSFNAETEKATQQFQEANWLAVTGHCDQATLDCLYSAEIHRPIQHNLNYQPRQGPHCGWAAALAMLCGSDPESVLAATPKEMLGPNGSLQRGSTEQRQRLMRQHGLVWHSALSLPVSRLIEALRHGPIGLERVFDPSGHQPRSEEPQFLVVAAARGSHGASGMTTTLRIYDPDPSQNGGIYSQTYTGLVRSQPGSRFVMITGQIGLTAS